MRTYLIVGGIATAIIVIAATVFLLFYDTKGKEAGAAPVRASFEADGVIVKNKPGFKKGGWYFDYEIEGKTYTAPILFSEISRCMWQESQGRCKPSAFIEGRRAHIKGMDLGEGAIGVVDLTFTEPPSVRE